MRVACDGGLNTNLGITMAGNHSDVRYSIALSPNTTTTTVDWDTTATADGRPLIADGNSTEAKTLWELVRGLSKAILVWNNISGNVQCIDVHIRDDDDNQAEADARHATAVAAAAAGGGGGGGGVGVGTRSSTPPPPVSLPVCTARDKQDSWEPIICNEHWNQVIYKLQGIGNDFFWPPNAPRNWTYHQIVYLLQYFKHPVRISRKS